MKFRINQPTLTEMSNGGQRTFKLFLCELLDKFLEEKLDADLYHLHHIDGNHENNKPQNLALMLVRDHRSLHGSVKGKDSNDYKDRLIKAFENFNHAGNTYHVDECLNHIFDKLKNGLGRDAHLDDIEVEQSVKQEVKI